MVGLYLFLFIWVFYISIFQTVLVWNGTDTERRTDVESIPLQRHVDVESVLVRCPPNQMSILFQESLQICFIIVFLSFHKADSFSTKVIQSVIIIVIYLNLCHYIDS